jgi:hypothetical protein
MAFNRSNSRRDPATLARVAYSYLNENEKARSSLGRVSLLMDPNRVSTATLERMSGQSGNALALTLKGIETGALLEEGVSFTSVRSAMDALGAQLFAQCLQKVSVASAAKALSATSGWDWGAFVRYSLGSSEVAEALAGSDDTMLPMATLVHKIGLLIGANAFGDFYANAVDQLSGSSEQLHDYERTALGVDHAFLAGYCLKQLSFPTPAIQAAGSHLEPAAGDRAATIAQACGLVTQQLGFSYGLSNSVPELDSATMEEIGLTDDRLMSVANRVSAAAGRADRLVQLVSG